METTHIAGTVNMVFEYWKVRLGHPRARLDDKRRRKIRQRLLDGYEEQDLIDAIDGCALSRFHMGENDRSTVYDDIELICRDAKHVDMFLAIKRREEAKEAKRRAEEHARRIAESEHEKRHEEWLRKGGRRPFFVIRTP